MAKEKAAARQNPLKIAGSAVFLAAAVGLFIHRLPHHQYLAVHPDKPRPSREGNSGMIASAPVSVRVPAKVQEHQKTAAVPSRAKEAAAQPGDLSEPPADWQDVCLGEIGVLCYGIQDERLRSCLGRYNDVLRKSCREALSRKSF